MKMNQETQAVYAKYGVSPTGSCVQLLIQMPILFALYRVIYENADIKSKITIGDEINKAYGSGIYIKQGENHGKSWHFNG